ncbi:methyltransferase domain-containing protein [Desulfovibrio mangrovi]|uniref:methyltransferase domain-containing protein n=1 Tax=Desulfovibrio mangrovi TaxID=2976983 RepID=UPI002247638A|nr:methyltransferase domain-containing protein [Desulfovibrio mangrovi]UZP66893.1 methyltransferase domain-containing protein [Desulfovibrio mangrovi]
MTILSPEISSADAPVFSLFLPTKDRHDMLVRMLDSVEAAAGGIPWEARVLYADPGDKASDLKRRFPQVVVYDQSEHFPPGRPTWPAMMRFLLGQTSAPWFMYASDDIVFYPGSIALAFRALKQRAGLAGGVAMAYRNVHAHQQEWADFGVDLTLGDQVLINYGFLNTALVRHVGGFSDEYKFYCADGDVCLRMLKAGYPIVPCTEAHVLHDNVHDELKKSSNDLAETDIATYRRIWTPTYYDVTRVKRLSAGKLEADPLLPQGNIVALKRSASGGPAIGVGDDALWALKQAGLHTPGEPLRLHLGCGENHLGGYVNIDYPPAHHAVMRPKADIFADIKTLHFPDNSLDEIRLHHVFEHFNRVEALGLLIRWHRWLKVGGRLHIETPDLAGSAQTLLSAVPFKEKTAAVRHLAGDQTETWAYHIDHWFPERFRVTYSHMGFGDPEIRTQTWQKPPHLANVTAVGTKVADIPTEQLLQAAEELLWLSTVAPSEIPTYEVWKRQLRVFLAYQPVHPATEAAPPAAEVAFPVQSDLPLEAIHDFNQRERDHWMAAKASAIRAGSRVLDVGAGTCPYRPLFNHCEYVAHDFKGYHGEKLGGGTSYGNIDLVGDITQIPAPDASFDVVLCTEVLEHVPDPVAALREMVRLLRPGGRLLLTAPLGSGLHQEPFHYYGGFTRHFYEKFLPSFGVRINELRSNGGFFRHLAQECARVSWIFDKKPELLDGAGDELRTLFREKLPRYLYAMDDRYMLEDFTVGYFVEGVKS